MFSYLKGTIGIVHSVNEVDFTVKVKLIEHGGDITEDLQVTSLLTLGKKIYTLPDINSPVLVIFFDDDTDRGFVLAGIYSTKNPSEGDKDKIIIDINNNKIILDRKTNKISILSESEIELISKKITANCNDFTVNSKNINLKGTNINLDSNKISLKASIINILGEMKSKFIIYAKDFLRG